MPVHQHNKSKWPKLPKSQQPQFQVNYKGPKSVKQPGWNQAQHLQQQPKYGNIKQKCSSSVQLVTPIPSKPNTANNINSSGKHQSNTNSTSVSEDEKVLELDANIQKKYQVLNRLGKGAYGIVWEAKDLQTGRFVALKKMFDAFRNNMDAQRTYREIFFLHEFGYHSNVIQLSNAFPATNNMDFYLVFPLMANDLHKLISKQPETLTLERIREITYQILKAIKYIHSADVIHRDLKPANILVDPNLNIKVADFGLARSITDTTENSDHPMTEYVATRWYRPPEILLNCDRQTKGVDMWSVGCILGEMINTKPLFRGAQTVEQVEIVFSSIEAPTMKEIEDIAKGTLNETLAKKAFETRKESISKRFEAQSSTTINLIEKLLIFHPSKRLTVDEAISHSFFYGHRRPNEELTAYQPVKPEICDNTQLSLGEYREKIYKFVKTHYNKYSAHDKPRPSTSTAELPPLKNIITRTPKVGLYHHTRPVQHISSLEKIQEVPTLELIAPKKIKMFPTENLQAKKSESYDTISRIYGSKDKYPRNTGNIPNRYDGVLETHKVRELNQMAKPTITRPSTSIPQFCEEKFSAPYRHPHYGESVAQTEIPSLPPINPNPRTREKEAETARIREMERKLAQKSPHRTIGLAEKLLSMKIEEEKPRHSVYQNKYKGRTNYWKQNNNETRQWSPIQNYWNNSSPPPSRPGTNYGQFNNQSRQQPRPYRKQEDRNRNQRYGDPPPPKPQSSFFAPPRYNNNKNKSKKQPRYVPRQLSPIPCQKQQGFMNNNNNSYHYNSSQRNNFPQHQQRRPYDEYVACSKDLNELNSTANNNYKYSKN